MIHTLVVLGLLDLVVGDLGAARNAEQSGGALGAITWGTSGYKQAWTSPAAGNSRSITFMVNASAVAVEISRTPADVPN